MLNFQIKINNKSVELIKIIKKIQTECLLINNHLHFIMKNNLCLHNKIIQIINRIIITIKEGINLIIIFKLFNNKIISNKTTTTVFLNINKIQIIIDPIEIIQ